MIKTIVRSAVFLGGALVIGLGIAVMRGIGLSGGVQPEDLAGRFFIVSGALIEAFALFRVMEEEAPRSHLPVDGVNASGGDFVRVSVSEEHVDAFR